MGLVDDSLSLCCWARVGSLGVSAVDSTVGRDRNSRMVAQPIQMADAANAPVDFVCVRECIGSDDVLNLYGEFQKILDHITESARNMDRDLGPDAFDDLILRVKGLHTLCDEIYLAIGNETSRERLLDLFSELESKMQFLTASTE